MKDGSVYNLGGAGREPFKDFYLNSLCKYEITILFAYFWVYNIALTLDFLFTLFIAKNKN